MSYNDEDFKAAFMARVKAQRERHGFSPGHMAKILGISYDTYRKYETDNMMPQRLIAIFSRAVGVSVDFMITGEQAKKRG